MKNRENPQTQSLIDLGFTSLEAEIYLFLLAESPVSGYRIAQALNRPAAQIYKVIEMLQQKGAVVADEGKTKLCRALPAAELLKHLEAQFRSRKTRADQALKDVPQAKSDHRVYQLKTVEQVYSRAESMLNQAERVVVMDLFPQPARRLSPLIEAATKRGVLTGVKVYDACEIHCTEIVVAHNARQTLERWPGQHLNLAVDAREFLAAMMNDDETELLNGVWSQSTYLSSLEHNGISSELGHTRLIREITKGSSLEDLQHSIVQLEPFYLSNCVSANHLKEGGKP